MFMASPRSRSVDPQVRPRSAHGVSRGRVVIGLCIAFAVALTAAAYLSRGRGIKSWVAHRFFGAPAPFAARPAVAGTRPGAYESSVALDGFVAAARGVDRGRDFAPVGLAVEPDGGGRDGSIGGRRISR
jgi:hypothetical protein